MIILRVIHTGFLFLLVFISYFVGLVITFCFLPFVRPKTRLFQAAAHYWSRFIAFFSGMKVETFGLQNIPPNKPLILVANHQGAADIPILLGYLPVYFRFAIKKELFKVPIFGWYLRQAGYFSIDREAVLSAYKTLEKIVEILKSGESVMVFPEGTRSRDGSLGKFKRGSLMAALKSGAPVIPIAISGSYNIMPRGTYLVNPSRVRLSVGQPIYIKDEKEYDEKVEEVRETIARLLSAHP
ncbi:MAG: lysophospholipid acyltransferase family protein [Candidatus Margulisbacteria bacterium]|nr:lysophospholipid acyltransferase family protein [Candidatus Margulisiibacteriota bacterium]